MFRSFLFRMFRLLSGFYRIGRNSFVGYTETPASVLVAPFSLVAVARTVPTEGRQRACVRPTNGGTERVASETNREKSSVLRPGVPRSSSAARRLNLRGGLGRLRAGSAPLVPAPRLSFPSLSFSLLPSQPSQSRLLDISSSRAIGIRSLLSRIFKQFA